MRPLRVCVADPIASVRAFLRDALTRSDRCVVDQADTGAAALELIRAQAPDIVIADACLPLVDGFALLRQIGGARPAFIITTVDPAVDAQRAFDYGAIDCMAKPLDTKRCHASIERARLHVARVDTMTLAAQIGELAASCAQPAGSTPERGYLTKLIVPNGNRSVTVAISSIERIAAEDCYSRIHADGASFLLRRTLGALERALDPSAFIRPHRSAMVSVERVADVQARANGDLALIMRSGHSVPVSQRRRTAIMNRLGVSFAASRL
jgi:two-component system LytT family response regulator